MIAPPSPTASHKRKATDEPQNEPAKRSKTQKSCTICYETGTTFPRNSINCKGAHSNDVCGLCWSKYLATEIVDTVHEDVQCIHFELCGAHITSDDVKRIAQKDIFKHYEWRIRRELATKTAMRECLADVVDTCNNRVSCRHHQLHDEETHGRVCTCEACGDRQCVRCGVREHDEETCDEFHERMEKQHGFEEDKTEKAFKEGYWGVEAIGKYGRKVDKWKTPRPCQQCGQMIERFDGCGRMPCPRCFNNFCSKCNAPYYGEGGVYDIGNAAHDETAFCPYTKHEVEDRRCKRKPKKAKNDSLAGKTKKSGLKNAQEGEEDVVLRDGIASSSEEAAMTAVDLDVPAIGSSAGDGRYCKGIEHSPCVKREVSAAVKSEYAFVKDEGECGDEKLALKGEDPCFKSEEPFFKNEAPFIKEEQY